MYFIIYKLNYYILFIIFLYFLYFIRKYLIDKPNIESIAKPKDGEFHFLDILQ